jgi:hypothetical protein
VVWLIIKYTKALFYALVVFLKKWAQIKNIPITKEEINGNKRIKLKMRGHKFRNGINWKGSLKLNRWV